MSQIDFDSEPVPMDDPPGSPRAGSPWNARLVAIGVMLTLAIVAGFAGAAIERLSHRGGPRGDRVADGREPGGRFGGPGRGGPGGPGEGRGRGGRAKTLQEQLTGALALTPTQRVAIDSAMAIQLREFEVARESVQPRLDSILRVTRERIEAILTPAQRAALPPAPDGRGPDLGPGPPMRSGRDGRGPPGGPGGRGGRDGRGGRRGGPPPQPSIDQ